MAKLIRGFSKLKTSMQCDPSHSIPAESSLGPSDMFNCEATLAAAAVA